AAGGRRVQVESAAPRRGLATSRRGLVDLRGLRGVRTQQIVKRVTAGRVFFQEVSPGELGQQGTDLPRRQPGEAGGGRDADVRAGMDAEEPEQPRRLRLERVVRPREDGPQIAGRSEEHTSEL